MDQQRTLRHPVEMAGIGLHSGEPVALRVSPAGADTGVLFRATDGTLIPANADHVVDTNSATTVGAFGVRVRTVEHLMAAAPGRRGGNTGGGVGGRGGGRGGPPGGGGRRRFRGRRGSAGGVGRRAPRRPLTISEPIRVGTESR